MDLHTGWTSIVNNKLHRDWDLGRFWSDFGELISKMKPDFCYAFITFKPVAACDCCIFRVNFSFIR